MQVRHELYRRMALSRAFEVAVAELWNAGRVPGEMHLGTGEEAVAAGVTLHLRPGDAVACDHRSTPVMVMRGVELTAMLREVLGLRGGLANGRAGHMHLFDRQHLAASSGIVGAAGPAGAGFALAARRTGGVAVSFFGEGAVNQGHLLESFNLAAAWELPQLFVCKDNGWSIFTRSEQLTGCTVADRARGFGLQTIEVDGLDAEAVADAVGPAVERARRGKGPTFLLATVSRLDGHLLGDPLVRAASDVQEGQKDLRRIAAGALSRGGGGVGSRVRSAAHLANTMRLVRKDHREGRRDPMVVARKRWRDVPCDRLDREAAEEVAAAADLAFEGNEP